MFRPSVSSRMSTRKLILTALVCGLLIVVAGGVKLFQVARDEPTVTALPLGDEATVADMNVSVEEVDQQVGATFVTVRMSGVEEADATEGWRLLAGGKVLSPLQGDDPPPGSPLCVRTSAQRATTCVVAFEATTGSVTVAYLRGGAQSQWAPR